MHFFQRWPEGWLALLFVALLPGAAGARGNSPGCALLAETRVTGESIFLSDLLPAETSPELREAAGKISLGAAPPPGGTVTLQGERIARILPASSRGELLIPPQVVVHRSSRPLTREEVVRAIQASLRHNALPGGLPGAAGLDPETVHFSAAVLVSASDAKLQVRRADFDAALDQDRFLLVSASDLRVLPFLVTVDRPSAAPENRAESAAETGEGSGELARALRDAHFSAGLSSGAPPLVEPRKLAKLHVFSGSMQMFLEVLPLERGGLHDLVRVKLPGSGQILRGEVTAPGRLEARF